MQGSDKLKDIACRYLDQYSALHGLARPLTPEQVKDAVVLLVDLLSAHEDDLRKGQ